jgi:sugar (pentulose or hexulose) kinase
VVMGGVLGLVEGQLGRRPAQLVAGLAHPRQGYGGGRGEPDVVVADDGQLLRHPGADGRVALVRSIVASLAEGYPLAVQQATALSGHDVRRVHVVGGGAQNGLLCRLLADRLGLPVLAGPVEATALGNVLVQGRANGALSGSLEDLRSLIARTHTPVVHQPTGRGAIV